MMAGASSTGGGGKVGRKWLDPELALLVKILLTLGTHSIRYLSQKHLRGYRRKRQQRPIQTS